MPENQSPAARRQRRQSDIIGIGFLILMLPIVLVAVVPMAPRIVVGGIYLFVALLLCVARAPQPARMSANVGLTERKK